MRLINQQRASAPLVAAGLGASQAFGFDQGVGSLAELRKFILPAQTGPLKALRLADYSAAGVNTSAVYLGQWGGQAGPSALGAKGLRSRYAVIDLDETVNDARAGSPPSVLSVVDTLRLLFMEALAQGQTLIVLSAYPFGDEVGVTTQQTDYAGAAMAFLLGWCEQAFADGHRVLSSDAAKLVGDIASFPLVIDVNMTGSSGLVGVEIGGTPITVTASGGDGATATALAAAVNAVMPGVASVVATVFVELTLTGNTRWVDLRPLGQGPVPSCQVFGTNASRTNLPTMQAGYTSATPGHANKAGADVLANELLRMLNLAYSYGW